MASYQDTRDTMMQQYPELFPNEAHVLEHLFVLIGNGYEWHDGELVAIDAESDESAQARCDAYEQGLLASGYDAEIQEQIRTRWRQPVPPITKLYPMSPYSRLVTLPEDIRPDWLCAAAQAWLWAIQVRHTREDAIWLNKVAQQIRGHQTQR